MSISAFAAATSAAAGVVVNGVMTMEVFFFDPIYSWSTNHGAGTTDGWGYDDGADYYMWGPVRGSLTPNTYEDGGATTQTVTASYYVSSDWVYFSLDGTGISNSDTTFVSIDINGNNYARSASTWVEDLDGGTHWYWAELSINPFGGGGGVIPFVVNI